jgi:L-ribulose-5-phosphate 3-epimerase
VSGERVWKKGIVIRAFANDPSYLAGVDFLHSAEDYSEIFRSARTLGFDGVQLYLEISKGVLNLGTSELVLEDIRRRAHDEGIAVPSLELAPLQYSFTSSDAKERKRGMGAVDRALEIAALLESPGVLVIPGYVGKMWDPSTDRVNYDDAYQRTLECLRTLAIKAESLDLVLLLEPIWNMFLLSPLEVRNLVDEVGSHSCGVLFDTGNVTLWGFAEQWIRVLGKRIREIHMKDFRRQVGNIHGFVPLLAGDVDWPAVTDAARKSGFEGFWIAEQFPYVHHGNLILEHTVSAMSRILTDPPPCPEGRRFRTRQ